MAVPTQLLGATPRVTGRLERTSNDLCDPESFIEYGPLVIAAQRARRDTQDLIERTPADGLVAGIGRVNGELFDDEHSRCAVLSYDYMVLAGTQGQMNHRKKDRLFELIERLQLPVVLFAEGGGGRPGDTDTATVTGLDTTAFALFGSLSGLAPSVGIVSGRCFAGNAALLGCCNVIIATKDATVGMGGPAMIEGGGLGTYRPEEVGPMSMQVPNGVVDILVDDEAAAVAEAKRFLSYFQGSLATYECADQTLLRDCVPEDRRRVYDVHSVIDLVSDVGSVQELRPEFAPGHGDVLGPPRGPPARRHRQQPDAPVRCDRGQRGGQSRPVHATLRRVQLPIVFLCDTPGFMVGPEAESTALVRHVSRLFVTGASLTTPYFTVILRKGYGLGAQSMAGGSFRSPVFHRGAGRRANLVAWGSRGRCTWAIGENSMPLPTRWSERRPSPKWWPEPTNTARRSMSPPISRSMTSSTRPRRAALIVNGIRSLPPVPLGTGQEPFLHRYLVMVKLPAHDTTSSPTPQGETGRQTSISPV